MRFLLRLQVPARVLSLPLVAVGSLGLLACEEHPTEGVTHTVTLATELGPDGALHVEGTIVLEFSPADGGPDGFELVDITPVPHVMNEPIETTIEIEDGPWPVVRGDERQTRTIRFSAKLALPPDAGLEVCPATIDADLKVWLRSDQGDVFLEELMVPGSNTCATCDSEEGDFAGIEDLDLDAVWQTPLTMTAQRIVDVAPSGLDRLWFLAAAPDGAVDLVSVDQDGNANAFPSTADAGIAAGETASVIVARSEPTKEGAAQTLLEVSALDDEGNVLWLTNIQSRLQERAAVAVADGRVFVSVETYDGLVIDGEVVDDAPVDGESHWLLLDEATGAYLQRAPGFPTRDVAVLHGGGFAVTGVDDRGRINLAALDPDLALRWGASRAADDFGLPFLAVAPGDALYLAQEKGAIARYESVGTETWSMSVGADALYTAVAVPDGRVHLASSTGALTIAPNRTATWTDQATWEGLPWCGATPLFGFGAGSERIGFVSALADVEGQPIQFIAGQASP